MAERPKLLITRPMPEPVLKAAREIADVTVARDNSYWRRDDIGLALTQYDVILPTLGDTVDKGAFDTALDMRCRLVANFGVGYNHIDVAAARKRGVLVTNTPGAVTDATADIAMTLLLMTARRAAEGERLARSGTWTGWHPTQMLGTHVTGKTLGIVGYGRIGRAVAHRAHFGFSMPIRFFNRSRVIDDLIPGALQVDTLADLMSSCDFVSVNVPGGTDNRHLIDAAALAAAKPGLILVNTARGDVIDEEALVAALDGGQIAGAGLDVYEQEPTIPETLRSRDDMVLLPHMGTSSLEVRTRMGLMAVDNIRAFLAGETPPNLL
jgi:lactate dehydrogenase-like 2-hydroxyacid dehydrogenase